MDEKAAATIKSAWNQLLKIMGKLMATIKAEFTCGGK